MTNESLMIEQLKLQTGTYVHAFLEFCEKNYIYDCEDLLEILDPIIVSKIRQEFIDGNYIPDLKKNNLFD